MNVCSVLLLLESFSLTESVHLSLASTSMVNNTTVDQVLRVANGLRITQR